MNWFRIRRCAALLAFVLVGATTGIADEPAAPKDEALDRLLEKLDKSATTPKAKADPTDAKPESRADKPQAKDGGEKAEAKDGGEKTPGDLDSKDKALDNLLERLGETTDKPAAEDERRGGPGMPGKEGDGEGKGPPPARPDQPAPGDLTGKSKDLDEHLEELTGRKRKKKQDQDEDGSGPLAQVIKEMREVEQRLGKPDTGEETRKKQAEIVKNLDQLIEQLRNSSGQLRGKRTRTVMMPGQKPGAQPGQQTGANAGGAPNQKPAKPPSKHAFANGKDEWGHLPPELRQEVENVAREVMLPSKEELIRLYYLSVSKKSLAREE